MQPTNADHHRPLPRRLAVTLTAAGLLLAACGDSDDGVQPATPERQAEVAERGASVMPFDLDATTHQFRPTVDGLVQRVVALDPDDREQVELIRQHLEEEAEKFAEGDFGDPASIHGDDMPGLSDLEAGADRIDVRYENLSDGARLTYTTDDPDLADALHHWGEAQVNDHGDHAEHLDHGDHSAP